MNDYCCYNVQSSASETFYPSFSSMGSSGGKVGKTRQSAYTSHTLKMKRRAKQKLKRKMHKRA